MQKVGWLFIGIIGGVFGNCDFATLFAMAKIRRTGHEHHAPFGVGLVENQAVK